MKVAFFCIACYCSIFKLYSQAVDADTLGIRFIESLRAADKEAVHLETDRNLYAAGEKIWFAAYLMEALNKKLDTSSKNLFVDLVNSKDSVVARLVLNAVTQQTSGAITIDDSLPTAPYWLRCYTKNMLTNYPTSAFVKPLFIINRQAAPAQGATALNGALPEGAAIAWYPEGGALITGLNSSAIIKITGADGNPLITEGKIVADKDSLITTFVTNKYGLAKISFYPVWYKKYTAIATINGSQVRYPLPAYNPYAVQLAVAVQTNENIQIHVAMEDSIYSRRFVTYLLAVNRDHVYFAGVGHGMYTLDIPAGSLPGGITTLLLFNGKQQIISERKIFINKSNYSINLKADKLTYAPRDNVHVDIEVKDAAGKPMVAALNIAVQDDKIMQVCDEVNADTLLPALPAAQEDWLKKNAAGLPAADIDMFMLAQPAGYNFVAGTQAVKATQVQDSTAQLTNLQGKITDKQKRPLKGRIVTAMSITKANSFFDADTTAVDGAFRLPLPPGFTNEQLQLFVTSKNRVDEPQDYILVDSFKFPVFTTPAFLKKAFTINNPYTTRQLKKYTTDTFFNYIGKGWLKPVVVTAVAKAKPTYDVSKRLSPFSKILTKEALGHGGASELGMAILKVPGVAFVGGKVIIRGGMGFTMQEPLIVMDGVPVTPDSLGSSSAVLNYLNTLSYDAIDFIEVLTGPEAAVYGTRAGNGVIAINSKIYLADFTPGYKIIKPITYHTAPAFDMPAYNDKKVKANKTPDPRTTIYWKGNLRTTNTGAATVDFFAADEAGSYSVIITGLTQNGEFIYKRLIISIK